MDGIIKKECLYYLNTYGSHSSIVKFYQRNNLTLEALNYIIEKVNFLPIKMWKMKIFDVVEYLFAFFLSLSLNHTLNDLSLTILK